MHPLDFPSTFNEWLKLRRKTLDLTQEELAQRASCSVHALRKIESGERRPSKQLAGLLAQALEIPPEKLQTFTRVARGELNLERLQDPADTRETRRIPKSAPASPPHNLPIQTVPMIGRQPELSALERLFTDPQCRLLTLTGLGGMGKTRLAIEFAASQLAMYPGGVYYVPLASLDSPDLIVPAIAEVIGVTFSGPVAPKAQLFSYFATQTISTCLLVLDNLEHLIFPHAGQSSENDASALVREILERLPNVRVLGTSRERLNLQGEWMYELHGLPVPPPEFIGKLEGYPAIELFILSARRVKADFSIIHEEHPDLIQICNLLEGIPLAIEMAAAWVGVLSLQEIAAEIEAGLDFLTTSMRDVPARHRSIRATFEHSWKLLPESESCVLQRLTVFQGGFSRQAAEQIAEASLGSLASLHAKSLVRRFENGRFDLHEVIRQYASTYFDADPQRDEIRLRHCEYFLTWIAEHEQALKSAAQQDAMRILAEDFDNVRLAWAWGIEHGQFALLEGAVRAFGWYYEVAGLYREGIEQLERVAQALKADTQEDEWKRLLGLSMTHQGLLTFRKGRFEQARRLYIESLDVLRPTGDPVILADALVYLGVMQHLNGDYEQAKLTFGEGLLLAQAGDDLWLETYASYNLGYIDSLQGNYAQGYEKMSAGLATWRTIGDPYSIALGLNFFVTTLNHLGRHEEAKAFMRESIELSEQAKNRWGLGTAYRYMGLAHNAAGEYAQAQGYFAKSLEIFGEKYIGWDIARTLIYLGDAQYLSGDMEQAAGTYLQALRTAVEARSVPLVLDAVVGLARLQLEVGNARAAYELAAYAAMHPAAEYETKENASHVLANAQGKLDEGQIHAIKERIPRLSIETIAEVYERAQDLDKLA